MSDEVNETISVNLSKDIETEGFDLEAGKTWIYPTNYPVRDYQFNIIQKALLKNTLVSLPTGLGKTFIAAVVMFNYFRWYPQGKVIFMAPTRPLVKQQIDACYDITAIPREATIEITGVGTKVTTRKEIWTEKRVFFITPQILQNDLDKFHELGSKIKCLVFDEAHRARGNHAYCEVIRKLSATNKYFRVLALSATPGGSVEDVLDIVQTLLISHLEFRTEESLDVSPYVFQRNLTTVVVPLGDKLQQVKDDYMKILENYTRILVKHKIIQGNCGNLTKGKIFMLTKNFQQQNRSTCPNFNEISRCLNICITLYHASELLIRHGLRSFLTFFDEHIEKPLIKGNTAIREIMADVREYLGPPPRVQNLPDGGDHIEIPENVKFGHPKFYKLRDILVDHFKESPSSSRVIVFFEYRESVMEAYALLIQSKPIIKPRIFVGQKQGVTQQMQIHVVKSFREGTCNVLLSTCIGEEGLDVGEVDLIVCFDISNKSPIRMVQRMGRTGRKKDGRIVVLVTEGKEQETLKDCLIHKNNVTNHVLGSKQLANGLRKESVRLVPEGLMPKCEKIFITVQKPPPKKGGNLKDMLRTLSSKSSEPSFSPNLQITDFQERIPKQQIFAASANAFDENHSLPNMFNKRLEKQRSFQEIHKIQHSKNSELLVNLLQLAESRRFNIPLTQISNAGLNRNLKQADIRSMFFKTQSANDFVLPPTQIPSVLDSLNVAEEKTFGTPALFTEITNFLSIQSETCTSKCKLCPTQIECGRIQYKNYSPANLIWVEPETSVFTTLTAEDLKLFEKFLDQTNHTSFLFDETLDFEVPNTPREDKILVIEDMIDESILADFCNNTVNFQAPKSLNELLNKYSTSIIDEELISQKPTKKIIELKEKTLSETDINNILNFFKLENLNSIFEENDIPNSQQTITYSPDIFNESVGAKTPVQDESEDSSSPILCSYVAKRGRLEVKSGALNQVKKSIEGMSSPSLLSFSRREFTSTPLTQKVPKNVPPDTPTSSKCKEEKIEHPESPKKGILQLEDLFDFSHLGLSTDTLSKIISLTDSCSADDFCENPLTKTATQISKISSNEPEKEKNDNPIDTSDLDCFFEKDLLDTLLTNCDSKICDNVDKKQSIEINQSNEKTSQALITRSISTANQPSKSSQKENKNNSVFDDDLDFFDISIMGKAHPKNCSAEKTPKSIKTKLNNSLQNATPSTSFDCSKCSLNISSKSVSPKVLQPKNTKKSTTFVSTSLNDSRNASANTTLGGLKSNESSNNLLVVTLSDDEFETKAKSPVWIRPKPVARKRKISENNSDDDFEISITSSVRHRPQAFKKSKVVAKNSNSDKKTVSCAAKPKSRKLVNQFIQDEAELSLIDSADVSDDEIETGTQEFDASFVSDETHNMDTQMHAVYLKSVRSPVLSSRFKIPNRPINNINVFSQQVQDEDDTYLDDSFVVHDETVETTEELSQLEILEKQLELQRKKKKFPYGIKKPSKRKRIFCVDSDDESD